MNSKPRLLTGLVLMLSILLFSHEGMGEGGLSQKSKKEILKEKRLEQKELDRIKASGIYSMSLWRYNYSFGKPEKKGIELSSVRYNANGYKVEETTFNQNDGSIFSKANYRYDDDGNLIEEITTKGDARTKTIYRYDSTGNKKEMVSYRQDGTVDRKGDLCVRR